MGETEKKARNILFWWDLMWGKERRIGEKERCVVLSECKSEKETLLEDCIYVHLIDVLSVFAFEMLRVETEIGRWGAEISELKHIILFREDGRTRER